MLVVGAIVIRVDDLERQLAFWTSALDYVVREPRGDDFALLKPRSGSGPNVSLDAAPAERVLPPRIHLDLYAEDHDAEVARLLRLGAARVEWSRMPPDADYVIMEDPEGNRFCVIDATGWPGWERVGARE
ncbi:VOC family protein [Microbacter sp. GSS18]|nr:VOC family protein [Microbacter sp. GSS18]